MDFKKESLFAWQILAKNEYAMKCALNDKDAVRFAVLNVAAIGLTLNPAQALCYLVPRGGKICLDISYKGLVKLATDAGSITVVNAELVYRNDSFEYRGAFESPKHTANYFSDRGDLVGVYVVAKLHDGSILASTPIGIDEIYRIRDRTEAWKAFVAGKSKSCPWSTDEGEMIKKTAIKRASKLWPKTERLSQAIEVINEHEGIDFKREQTAEKEPIKAIEIMNKIEKHQDAFNEIVQAVDYLTEGKPLNEKAQFMEDHVGVLNLSDLHKASDDFVVKVHAELMVLKKEEETFRSLKAIK